MPMLLQQPSHVLLSTHEADQPLDFTMSKFKTKTSSTVASQLKQFNNFTAQQQMMLLHNNGMYFNRSNNNKSFTRGSSPSSSSEEEGVGPPASSPRSSLPSPGPLRGDVFQCTPSDVQGKVYHTISKELGHNWKLFARALGISEGEIDELEERHRRVSDRVLEILHHHESNCDQRRWRTFLLEALTKARRSDLRLHVAEIFDTYC